VKKLDIWKMKADGAVLHVSFRLTDPTLLYFCSGDRVVNRTVQR